MINIFNAHYSPIAQALQRWTSLFANALLNSRINSIACLTSAQKADRSRVGMRSYSSCKKTVRIGCASGFWGDTATAVPQLVYGGKLDFLVFDYLSEITMSLLTAAKTKNPALGYVPDFVQVLAPFLKEIHKKGIRVVSNAGGVNPLACTKALQESAQKAGLTLKIAMVTGDDLMAQKDLLTEVKMADSEIRKALPRSTHSMNAYLGAQPIRRCLDLGADVVITGRCADSAVVLGPLIHWFGWDPSNYNLLAAGSLAGHLIECGAQCTGGVFTDWHIVPDWGNIGFPVVECSADGSFVLSKPPQTGGLVSFGTVAEQLVYEIDDPGNYVLPDVTCDFSQVTITEVPGVEGGAVKVEGAKGAPPSSDYKVCATYLDGYRSTAVSAIGGPRVAEKARRTADGIIRRTQNMFRQLGFEDYSSVNVQVLGVEDTYGPHASKTNDPREAVLWLAVHHKQKKALEVFSREVTPAGTGMAPGFTAIVGGRPYVSPVLKPFFFLYPKTKLKVTVTDSFSPLSSDCILQGLHKQRVTTQVDVHINGDFIEQVEQDEIVVERSQQTAHKAENITEVLPDLPSGPHSYRLEQLAYTRSGDKGDTANIGVVARHPLFYPYLRKQLTASVVEEYFQHLIQKDSSGRPAVARYELPGIHGLNFTLRNSLGGGGVASLRSDPQGKAFGQMLLDYKIKGLPDLKSLVG